MKRFSQFRQREGNRFKQRLVPFFNGVYGIYAKLRKAVGNPIVISDASDEPLVGLKVFGKSTQNGTPTPDSPVEIVSVENPVVAVRGKNLIPFPYPAFKVSGTGITATVQDDGGVLLNGTPSDNEVFINLCKINFGIESTLPNSTHGFISNKYSDKLYVSYDAKNNYTFIVVKPGMVCDNIVIYPQLEAGLVATNYEKGRTEQSLSIPHTLNGIPVSSGGNYTDKNGQQWICDEVDFERGVYVQSVFRKVFDGTETLRNNWFPIMVHEIESPTFYADVNSNVICNYFDHTYIGNVHGTTLAIGSLDKLGYTNVSEIQELMVNKYEDGQPVILQYCLKTPIETPLTTEQIEAYKALHTNEPNTTILNDQNAWMEVMYTSK